jgi:hypothetical protein
MCCNRPRPRWVGPLPSSGASVAGQGRQSDERGSAYQRLPQRRTQRHPRNQPGCACNPGTLARIKHRGPLHEESSAPRRGLADGATERAPGSAVGSLALAGTSPSPSRSSLPSVAGAVRRSTVRHPAGRRVVVVSRMLSGCLPCRGRSVCVLGRVHVSGVRCTVRVCDVHASAVRCPGPGRPVSGVGVRASCVRGVCTGDFVEASGRRAAHGQRGPGLAVLPYPRTADHRPEPEWLLVWPVWRGVGCVAQGGGGDYAAWSSWEARVESAGL